VTLQVRPTEPHEYRSASDVFTGAIMYPPASDELWEQLVPSWDESHSFSAWDGDLCVGHASHMIVETTVPGGGRVSTGAVGRVGVASTHRRRGIARGLMGAVVADARDRGVPMLSLRASEATIYGRFGFGLAGDSASVTIDPARARPITGRTASGSFRVLGSDEILSTIEPLYDRVAHRRPGVIARPRRWQQRYLKAAIDRSAASYVVVHHDDEDRADGYAHYTTSWDDDGGGVGKVHDVWGASDAVELALWRFVLDIDLVAEWKAAERPVDDLLRRAIRDVRGYRTRSVSDEQWVRLVDVDAALAARAYNDVPGHVTIAVTDPLIEANNGTWRVGADGVARIQEATGTTADAATDLTADIATLSAAYLGGPTWSTLVATGGAQAIDDEAVSRADALFSSRPGPFCGSFF
jgi:predicted acetyltransferase